MTRPFVLCRRLHQIAEQHGEYIVRNSVESGACLGEKRIHEFKNGRNVCLLCRNEDHLAGVLREIGRETLTITGWKRACTPITSFGRSTLGSNDMRFRSESIRFDDVLSGLQNSSSAART